MFRNIVLTVLLAANVAVGQETQPASPEAAEPSTTMSVEGMSICRAIENRAPVDEGDSFPASVGSLYCFARVSGAESPTSTYHRWYVGEEMVREIPISVKSSPWRCWSVKSMRSQWSGACRVDIVDESGEVLGSKSFTLTAAAEPQD